MYGRRRHADRMSSQGGRGGGEEGTNYSGELLVGGLFMGMWVQPLQALVHKKENKVFLLHIEI